MRTIDTPKGLAARLGGWSARHKKSVLAGWFVFVALAMMVSMFVPANKLTKADQFTGESGRAEKTLESSFPKPASEMVLIHSSSLTTEDAAFARGISQTAAGLPIGIQVGSYTNMDESVLSMAKLIDMEFGYRPPVLTKRTT